ncbi:MAG: hypothetical protein ACOY94_08955 [Bacillota bacterium]
MAEDREKAPVSPTELGLRFALPIAGLGEVANMGEAGAEAAALPLAAGLALDDGLQAVPGQSGAEGLADLPQAREDDPFDGP